MVVLCLLVQEDMAALADMGELHSSSDESPGVWDQVLLAHCMYIVCVCVCTNVSFR